ncbi:MAG: NACHT domain-containing protein, partial [bacterium]
KLIEDLTGYTFYLASSGRQYGKDISSESVNGSVIAIECKRYGKSTELNNRELLGEISQAYFSMPFLDLWVLVTSKEVNSQLYEELNQEALSKGLIFEAISDSEDILSSLEVLCSYSPDIVFNYINNKIVKKDKITLEKEFERIRNNKRYYVEIDKLKKKFSLSHIGYSQFTSAQNAALLSTFNSEKESRNAYGQVLNISEVKEKLVKRKNSLEQINRWYSQWQDNNKYLVILGEEGDGKTWSIASWLERNIKETNHFPPVIFLSSKDIETEEPINIIVNALTRIHEKEKDYWLKKINNWLKRDNIVESLFIIVIDGINERFNHKFWRRVLEKFSVNPFNNKIGLVITSRTGYWRRYLDLDYLNTREYIIKPFNDEELSDALSLSNLNINDIPNNLMTMIRKPRYFDLMLKHYKQLYSEIEITPARLVYEDWKDRYNRKSYLELDNETFQEIIKQLAFEYKDDLKILSKQVAELLPATIEDTVDLLNELITGGILQGKEYKYRINDKILVLGFALLLVDELKQECINDRNLIDVIEELLEPYSGLDIKAEICESAVLHSFITICPDQIKVNLLYVWVNSQNTSSKIEETFPSYFPNNETTYVRLAEIIWKAQQDNPWAQKLMMDTFLQWKDILNKKEIILAFERWLGFININGFVFQRGNEEKEREKIRNNIIQKITDKHLNQGFIKYDYFLLNIIEDDGLLRLGRFALAIISHLPRKPYIHALAIGSLSEAIMGYADKYKIFSWILNTSKSLVFNSVKEEVDKLLKIDTKEAQQAAYRLLSYEGSKKSYELQKKFPEDLFKKRKLLADKGPCDSFRNWERENLNDCLCRDDINIKWQVSNANKFCIEPDIIFPEKFVNKLPVLLEQISMKNIKTNIYSTIEDSSLKDIEPIFYATSPDELAGYICKLSRSINERTGMELRQLSFYLLEHYLIYKNEQIENIFEAWEKLYYKKNNLSKDEETAEMLLFEMVLLHLNFKKQLTYLSNRPKESYDLIAYKPKFKKVIDWNFIEQKLSTAEDQEKIKRILWFISVHSREIPDCLINKIIKYINHSYSEIRGLVLEILYNNNLSKITDILKNIDWEWLPENSLRENHWGSIILCESQFSYKQINYQIDPSYLGYAVSCRGSKTDDLLEFINDIEFLITNNKGTNTDINQIPGIEVLCHREKNNKAIEFYGINERENTKTVKYISKDAHWGGGINSEDKDIFNDWNESERIDGERLQFIKNIVAKLKEEGKTWFVKRVNNQVFETIIKEYPQKIDEWLNSLFKGEHGTKKRLLLNQSFYEAICEHLLKSNNNKGKKLYRKLKSIDIVVFFKDEYTEIPILDYSLFKSNCEGIENEWTEYLDSCISDNDLLNLILLLEEPESFNWLWEVIDNDLQSKVPFYNARALTLLGFQDDEKAKEILEEYCKNEHETWLDIIVTQSLKRFNKNIYAKYWFSRFVNEKNNIEAWRSFRLFLQCVDRRFWVWGKEFEIDKKLDYLKYNYYYDNISKIKNSIKKNEKKYRDYYLNHKILETESWPWM